MHAKQYQRVKLAATFTKSVLVWAAVVVFVALGGNEILADAVEARVASDYLAAASYVLVVWLALSALTFPLEFFVDFHLERRYGLSEQTFGRWFLDETKSVAIAVALFAPLAALWFHLLRTIDIYWFLPFGGVHFLFTVVLAQLAPTLLLPLFYDLSPLEDEGLRERLRRLAERHGLRVESISTIGMSKRTKKANAAFAGLGATKRLLVGDTLLEICDDDEIEAAAAHEIGHYKNGHIVKLLVIGGAAQFALFLALALLYDLAATRLGYAPTDLAAIPLFLVVAAPLFALLKPAMNALSRRFEYEADRFAARALRNSSALVSALKKISDRNLGDPSPHPFVEWYFYSHPSITKRARRVAKEAKWAS
ncbi:MAG: M48 family metalloprotease [Ignavibacteriales bacterium]|nr:M48 family metalloprotease [Ignavibacteriales bacterium]